MQQDNPIEHQHQAQDINRYPHSTPASASFPLTDGTPPSSSTPAARPSPLPLASYPPTAPAFPGQLSSVPSSSASASESTAVRDWISRKRKWESLGYSEDEIFALERVGTGLHLSLLLDQDETLFPPPPTAFKSYEDAVDRLLPYHVWQIHDEELEGCGPEEKERAKEAQELAGAQDLVRRISGVKERFARVRRREGHHPSNLPSLISMLNNSTLILREELNVLQTSLRSTRIQYETLDQESKRQMDLMRRDKEKGRIAEEEARKNLPVDYANTVSQALEAARMESNGHTDAESSLVASQRGRGRGGKVRGRGRGGLRESVLTHTPSTPGTPGTPSKPTLVKNDTATSGTNGTPTTGTPAMPQAPVSITVAMGLIPQFVSCGLLVIPPNATASKPPATVVRTTDDKKSVVLSMYVFPCILPVLQDQALTSLFPRRNLSACSQAQLQSLAKLLNVSAKPNSTSPAPATPTPARPQASSAAKPKAAPSTGSSATNTRSANKPS
ncbi:hypothetical protein P7C73_g4920, partial [Tremellales sp. Uapishka_1]